MMRQQAVGLGVLLALAVLLNPATSAFAVETTTSSSESSSSSETSTAAESSDESPSSLDSSTAAATTTTPESGAGSVITTPTDETLAPVAPSAPVTMTAEVSSTTIVETTAVVTTVEQPAVVLRPIPPAIDQPTPVITWVIAAAVLILSALVVLILRRRIPVQRVAAPTVAAPADPRPVRPGTAIFAAVEAVGEAMIDAGYSVDSVQSALEDMAAVNGFPTTEVVALPTALFVSTRGGDEVLTGAVASGGSKLLLHQVDALDRLVRSARLGKLTPLETVAGVEAIRQAPPPARRAYRVAAYLLLSAGIAVLLGASWSGVAFSAAFGAVIGTVLLLTERAARQYQPLVTVGSAFGVSIAVFLVAGAGYDPGVLPSLIAPLVIMLPGALLTTGIIELSTGQMMSGAGRLAAGFMQLILLAVGIVAGSSLVGVPQIDLTEAQHPIGPLGPWVAVAAFGIGIVIHQGGRFSSIPWILLVLYVAYGAQVIGDIFFGGVLSALIGALVMTPVAILVSRQASGPAAMTSFLPAFWLLVPGALGLVGVTSILGGDGAGATTLVTTISTMVAIALGILAGSALSGRLRSSHRALL